MVLVTGGQWWNRVAGARRPMGSPSVIFLDERRWDSFNQLASQLRLAGVRTVRLTTERGMRSQATSLLVFDRHVVLSDGDDDATVRTVLAEEDVLDIQFVETLGHLVRRGIDLLANDVASEVVQRLVVSDKLRMSHAFTAAGVRTPPVAGVAGATPEDIADRFGLPVVVKPRIGSGQHVTIARDLATLRAAMGDREVGPDGLYAEQHVEGCKFNFAASVSNAGSEQELAYLVVRWKQPVGQATEVETVDDDQLVAIGRAAIEAAGCTGLINMDIIRDAQGRDWLVDFNARAFGGAANFLSAGIDVSEGYLRAIGRRSAPPTSRVPEPNVRVAIFPESLRELVDSGSVGGAVIAFLRASLPYLRWLGLRYWLSVALRTPDALITSAKARLRSA